MHRRTFLKTLASTGSVARLLTARLTVWSPRARFSCITETFMPTSRYPPRVRSLHRFCLKNTHPSSSPSRRVDGVDETAAAALGGACATPADNCGPAVDDRPWGWVRAADELPASVDEAYRPRRPAVRIVHTGREISTRTGHFSTRTWRNRGIRGARHSE